ncbi:hypothetical protein [Paenibacillus favisporus]
MSVYSRVDRSYISELENGENAPLCSRLLH